MADKAEKKSEAPRRPKRRPRANRDPTPAPAGGPAAGRQGGISHQDAGVAGRCDAGGGGRAFVGFKFLTGGPQQRQCRRSHHPVKENRRRGGKKATNLESSGTVELPLLESRFPNKRSGKTFLYDVKIVLSVKKESADKVKSTIGEHDALIQDRVRTIIAESDPDKLGGGAEPGLETLRRQVKYQLDEIVGDGLIDDVLIPQCIPFPADY